MLDNLYHGVVSINRQNNPDLNIKKAISNCFIKTIKISVRMLQVRLKISIFIDVLCQ